MWADRVVVVGSQDVIAAKCCPGHSLESQEEKEDIGERTKYISEFKVIQVSTQVCVYKCHISEKQALVISN